MEFWQSLAFTEPEQLVEVARMCEEVGFDGVMLSDHLLHFEHTESPYPYSENGKPPFAADTVWPECWSTIAALAAVTRRLRFVTNVFILPLRNPIEVAKATSSVATFAEGRLILGAGAGWMKEEFDVLGVDFATRGKRFEECIEVLRRLWSGKTVEYHGRFFSFPPVRMLPAPKQPIPIYIGGMSTVALRRAATLGDGWIGAGQTAKEALESLRTLGAMRSAAGRAERPFQTVVALKGDPVLDDLRRLQEAGLSGTVSYPFTFTIGSASTLQQKREYLESYANRVIAKVRR